MLKFIVLFVLCAVVTSSAYDFKDGPFNELIFENYKELSEQLDEPQSLRSRRDIEEPKNDSCKWKKESRGLKCCNDKTNQKAHDVLRELKKECFKEINGDKEDEHHFDPFTCEKLEELKSQIVCIGECVGRKLAILDDSGNIIRDVLVEHMKTKLTDSEQWKLDASEGIIDKCLAEIKTDGSSSEDVASSSVAPKCNPSALKFGHCMWREYVRACPKDLQVDSPKCIKMREKLENGDNSIKKSFYLRHFHYHEEKK